MSADDSAVTAPETPAPRVEEPREPIKYTEEELALIETAVAQYPHVDRYLIESMCVAYLKDPSLFDKLVEEDPMLKLQESLKPKA